MFETHERDTDVELELGFVAAIYHVVVDSALFVLKVHQLLLESEELFGRFRKDLGAVLEVREKTELGFVHLLTSFDKYLSLLHLLFDAQRFLIVSTDLTVAF